MIERNKHVSGRIGNILFGLACIADGLVRVLSLGFLHTRFPIEVSKAQVKRLAARDIAMRQQNDATKMVDKMVDRMTADAAKLAKKYKTPKV